MRKPSTIPSVTVISIYGLAIGILITFALLTALAIGNIAQYRIINKPKQLTLVPCEFPLARSDREIHIYEAKCKVWL